MVKINILYRFTRSKTITLLVSVYLLLTIFSLPARAEVEIPEMMITGQTTVAALIQQSQLPQETVYKALGLKPPVDANQTLVELGIQPEKAKSELIKAIGIKQTDQSKNWKLILGKFALWTLTLVAAGALLYRAGTLKSSWGNVRLMASLAAAVVFGVLLGSDPNPMGTVKDAFVFFWPYRRHFSSTDDRFHCLSLNERNSNPLYLWLGLSLRRPSGGNFPNWPKFRAKVEQE